MRRILFLLSLLATLPGAGRAQESLIGRMPFSPAPHPVSPAGVSFVRLAAPQALALGLPELAASLYRAALAAPDADRQSLSLALAAALLDAGHAAEAEAALAAAPDHEVAAWHLRRGLAELALWRIDSARLEATAITAGQLSAEDQPWFSFLEGALAAAGTDPGRAAPYFQQALQKAGSALARARFQLAELQQALRRGAVAPEALLRAGRDAARAAGQPIGFDYARTYAVMLDRAGRKTDAVRYLEAEMQTVPAAETGRRDDFWLLTGVIGGAAAEGRAALLQLLERGGDEDRRRIALELLADASRSPAARAEFRAALDRMIDEPGIRRSPLLDDLLLYRAAAAVDDGANADAIALVRRLLTEFPGSELRPYALAVQTRAEWDRSNYLTAATVAEQARTATHWADGKALFEVVVAEAWFRAGLRSHDAGDFRAAAAAYATVVRRPPAGMPPSELRFQRVESLIEAGDLAAAAGAIDEMAHDPGFNVVDRWRSELNLAFALQASGDMAGAYARVNRVLAEPLGPGMPPELRGRMAWLQADLAYEDHQYETAIRLAAGLDAATARVPQPLQTQIRAWGPLLQGRALFALGREAEARAALNRLRAEHPSSDAAIESYLTEAAQAAAAGQPEAAERLLLLLADRFPESGYADMALFQAAQLAAQRRQTARAQQLIERMVGRYPTSALVFDARMAEGNLLRSRDEFALAQQTYELLMNNPRFAGAPDRVLAELALADCHSAQATDAGHAEKAASLYQDILESESLLQRAGGTDIRVEAGCKLGELYQRRGRATEAQTVWFAEVVRPFLMDGTRAAQLGATGRYWMGRTVFDLGDAMLAAGHAEEARTTFGLGEKAGLLDAAMVRKRLSLSAGANSH